VSAEARPGHEDSLERDLDAVAGRVAAELLAESHFLLPDAAAEALAERARPLGVFGACIYLADLQQANLRPMPRCAGQVPEVLAVDSTVAGRAYQTVSLHHLPADDQPDAHRVWIPLVDGTERLGVLELLVGDVGEKMLEHYRMLASLAGLLVVSKSNYSDTYAQTRRSRQMALQAEMVWAYMAPRTFATDRVLITAILEPAYEVGGDAYDYSLIGDRLHVSVFDGVGHDLGAGLLTSVALASCRSTRRSGGALPDIVALAGQAIAEEFGDSRFGDTRFVTALLCDLDITTGAFSWIPCGHPPPLLIRGNRVVKELARRPELPLGIPEPAVAVRHGGHPGEPGPEGRAAVYVEQLEPGDRVLLYSDGVTEGRGPGGIPFGEQRFADFIIRHSHGGTPAPEMLRRLNRAIVDYQHGRLSDDATTVMLEWMPDHPEQRLLP
jgi:serine phosphatase RsbU (regulator of sigma subunit)